MLFIRNRKQLNNQRLKPILLPIISKMMLKAIQLKIIFNKIIPIKSEFWTITKI